MSPATEPHPPWHRKLLDVALRFGDRQSALALAEHWAGELPTSQRAFTSPSGPATITLYSHAASAALSDTQTDAEQLLPASLRPPAQGTGHSYDPHTSEREGWLKRVDPLITAGLLHVRAVLGQADAGDVEAFCTAGLQTRTELTTYRWFTYDREFRAWATMVACAAIETGAPAVIIDHLADAAPGLLRGGAPTLWLDLADVLAERGAHPNTAADLCLKAAQAARDDGYDAADRLELLAQAAGIAGTLHADLGRNLFDQAVEAAAGDQRRVGPAAQRPRRPGAARRPVRAGPRRHRLASGRGRGSSHPARHRRQCHPVRGCAESRSRPRLSPRAGHGEPLGRRGPDHTRTGLRRPHSKEP